MRTSLLLDTQKGGTKVITAICPGSFDPVTLGHLDIIHRASDMFDQVIVAVLCNSKKHPSFSVEERMDMIRRVTADIPNVEVATFDGLLADFAAQQGATVLVKGLRAVTDFEYEFQMALANRKLNPNLETVFITTRAENMYLASSLVKEIARNGGSIDDFVPAVLRDEIQKRLVKGN
ncbi:MAG: pantetheine-phosphate adenylyltransferase [Clostridia bacterium]|nr:pantetheine-phosphate adenylyltransferase [Clostridia bacterium]